MFRLIHPAGSKAERRFFEQALVLTTIPGVINNQRLKQVSAKNTFQFLFSMEFDDQAVYDSYKGHPVHTAFVREKWNVEVG
ncbi:Dabb family protein [Agrobacterium tumefaciens]|uniref:Dabb family protein n=1 Tax=Agrobacterium tumefaciens TaxID=358 RepID=UPI003AF58857